MNTTGHKTSWFVYVCGERIPRESTMRGQWDYDATCSCGWDTRTGGAVKSYITREVADHKWDVALANEVDEAEQDTACHCNHPDCGAC